MSRTFVHRSASLASHSSAFRSFLSLWLLVIFSFSLTAQDSLSKAAPDVSSGTLRAIRPSIRSDGTSDRIDGRIARRVRFIAISNLAAYSLILIGLNTDWYANYPRSSFHFFNDNEEWLQVDKVGHMYSAYIESRSGMEMWRWTGI